MALWAGAIVLAGSFSVGAQGSTTVAWTSRADFERGSLTDLDAQSEPGRLRLIGVASPWVKSPSNPILGPGTGWDGDWVTAPAVLYEGGTYKMWYQGCAGGGSQCDIGYATSPDGRTWTRYPGNPVLNASATGWALSLGTPTVINDGGTYRLWYSGDDGSTIRIGHATSPDGITWTNLAGPSFAGGFAWDSGSVTTPAVVLVGGTFILYFSGQSGDFVYKIGRATSPNGYNWTEDPANPLLSPSGGWEESRIHPASVLVGPSGYEMYYTGAFDLPQSGRAFSTDGRIWTRDSANPTLRLGPRSSWDSTSVQMPRVVVLGENRTMYYGGRDEAGRHRIGVADFVPGSGPPTYRPHGLFLSDVVDSGSPSTTWDSLEWSGTVSPVASIEVNIRVGNTALPDASWFTLPGPTTSPGRYPLSFPRARYAQVGALLVSWNVSETPRLDEISVSYSPPGPPPLLESLIGGVPLYILLLLVAPVALLIVIGLLVLRAMDRSRAASPSIVTCPKCRVTAVPAARFCGRCGASLSGPPAEAGPPLK